MTQHGHAVANSTSKEEQTTKQRSEIRSAHAKCNHESYEIELGILITFSFTFARGQVKLRYGGICLGTKSV